jgi:hypothetical protein
MIEYVWQCRKQLKIRDSIDGVSPLSLIFEILWIYV